MKNTAIIVEDEKILALGLKSILTSLGWEVLAITDNCQQAVSLSNRFLPGLIVMDIHLSTEETGIDAAEMIRTFSHCPIVFQSSCTDPEILEKAIGFPQSEFIPKTLFPEFWQVILSGFQTNVWANVA
jgi:CheY-like chemotaxis protein